MNKKIILCLLIVTSCSSINQESRDHYANNQKIRHGIIPLNSKTVSKKIAESSVARGKELYQKHCISCHGENGIGNGIDAKYQSHAPANLQKLAREVSDFKFFMSISQWNGDMPGWKEEFNDSDREDLVAYIKTFR